jgi:DNA-binding Xre family transcriptional regulator
MARNFNELRQKMSPERRAKNDAETERMIREMPLDELRAARELTQQHLAQIFKSSQGSISRLERRTDMYISTLEKFIEAMGGKLEIRAVRITQFGEKTRNAA